METQKSIEALTFNILHKEHAPMTLDQIKDKFPSSILDEILIDVLSQLTQEKKIQKHSLTSTSKKTSTKSTTLYWTEDIFGNHKKESDTMQLISNYNTEQKVVDQEEHTFSKSQPQDTPKTPSSGLQKKRPQPFKSNTPFKTPWKSPSSGNSNNNTPITPVNKKHKVGVPIPSKVEELEVESMTEEQLNNEVTRLSQMLSKKEEQYQHLQQQLESSSKPQKLVVMNEDGRLDPLVKKWTHACQRVLLELQQKAKQETTIGALLDHFGVEEDLRNTLRYVPESDEFQ